MGRRLALVLFFAAGGAGIASPQGCPLEVAIVPWSEPAAASAASGNAGEPARVTRIDFTGNRGVSTGALRRAMATKRARLGRPDAVSRWDRARWEGEHRRLCAALRAEGHVTGRVGPPQVTEVPDAPPAGGPRRVVVTIPVDEGPRYRMGDLAFEGLSVLDEEEARALVGLPGGATFDGAAASAGLEALRRRYASRGYAEWDATAVLRPDPAQARVDVLVRVKEGEPRFVGRIVFTGHRGTLDQTLRREVLLDEGELLDTERLRASVERIEGLGYVAVRGVRLAPNARSPQALDVVFEVEPRPVLRYGLAGGVSGLEGASLTAQLGTVNFFGRGERVWGSVQLGELIRSFDLAASRPYVLGSRWTLGGQLKKERLERDAVTGGGLPAYTRDETAFRVQTQRPLGGRAALWLGYALSTVTLEALDGVSPPAGFGRRRESELGATLRFDGWDHPWKPRRGLRATGWSQWASGTVDYWKTRGRAFALAPLGRAAAVGLGGEAGWLRPLGSGPPLPFDERFLLGSESDLRGFDLRSVGPRDAAGALVGGTRYLALQAEAHADVTRGLRAVAFVDAGQAWEAGGWPGLGDLLVSTGVEVRFAMPVFRLPVRLIYAYNPAREDFHRTWKFRVAIGPLP